MANTSDSGYGVASSSPDEGALSMPGCRRRRLWVNHAPSLTPAACYRAVCEAWSASEMEYSSPGLVLEYIPQGDILVLGLDLRLPVLGLDSYSATAVLVNC